MKKQLVILPPVWFVCQCVLYVLVLISIGCQDQHTQAEQTNAQDSPTQAEDISVVTHEKNILFFGNSLTAGYMLEEDQSFPALIQKRLDSLGMDYQVINAGLSGETTAGGVGRIDWVLQQPVDIFILELGANDALRGLDVSETETNLRLIIDKVKAKNTEIPVVIAGMLAPPNMGVQYTDVFNHIFGKLAEEYNAGLIPFLLEGVAANPELNLADGIHPNVEGHKIVMENVWQVLKDYL